MLTEFSTFDNRPVVSFDFDGVLHSDVYPGTTHPIDIMGATDWTPNEKIHDILRMESQAGNKIIIVTSRHNVVMKKDVVMKKSEWVPVFDYIVKFLRKYNLPVSQVQFTNDTKKLPFLRKLGVIRHYDDNPELKRELKNSNIEFVFIKNNEIEKRIINTKK